MPPTDLLATAELARRLRVTPSAVNQHLKVLHGAGLLTKQRHGRQVLLPAQLPRGRADRRQRRGGNTVVLEKTALAPAFKVNRPMSERKGAIDVLARDEFCRSRRSKGDNLDSHNRRLPGSNARERHMHER